MGQIAKYILSICVGMLLMGCKKDAPPPPVPVDRVLMVYMAADNNLSGYVQANIEGLIEGTRASTCQVVCARTLVYLDTPKALPRIVEITAAGQKELYRWPSPHNSASAATVQEAIAKMGTLAPATHYGLVMWSHGMAWVPSSADNYFSRSRSADVNQWPETKYFGQDTGMSLAGYLETADLAAAIPNGVFDYILFDACFMASVEVLYALRGKIKQIIAAPTEVIADGFPYAQIIPQLLRTEPDLKAVCQSFFDRYAQDSDPRYRSATISLVRTAELEALALVTAELYTAALSRSPQAFAVMEWSALQPLDRYRRHFLFDMGSVVSQLEQSGVISSQQVALWREQLARTILYEAHTDKFFDLTIGECCGLSTYIPLAAYTDLNADYKTLEWSQNVGL